MQTIKIKTIKMFEFPKVYISKEKILKKKLILKKKTSSEIEKINTIWKMDNEENNIYIHRQESEKSKTIYRCFRSKKEETTCFIKSDTKIIDFR